MDNVNDYQARQYRLIAELADAHNRISDLMTLGCYADVEAIAADAIESLDAIANHRVQYLLLTGFVHDRNAARRMVAAESAYSSIAGSAPIRDLGRSSFDE